MILVASPGTVYSIPIICGTPRVNIVFVSIGHYFTPLTLICRLEALSYLEDFLYQLTPIFDISVTQSEQDRSCILLVRMQRALGDFIWVHTVLQVRDAQDPNQQPVIVCTNQVLK